MKRRARSFPLRSCLGALGRLGILAVFLTTTGCAVELPWPPPREARITVEAHRRRPTRYRIDGKLVTRAEVDALVLDTPERREAVVRADHRDTAATAMFAVGAVGFVGGAAAASATQRPALTAIPLSSVALVIASVILAVAPTSPWQKAVVDFNDAARRKALVSGPEEDLPPASAGPKP